MNTLDELEAELNQQLRYPEAYIAVLERDNREVRSELAKWEKPHTESDLEEMRLQAQQPSLAAKQAYINALEWHLADLRRELAARWEALKNNAAQLILEVGRQREYRQAYSLAEKRANEATILSLNSQQEAATAQASLAISRAVVNAYDDEVQVWGKWLHEHGQSKLAGTDVTAALDAALAEARRGSAEEMRDVCCTVIVLPGPSHRKLIGDEWSDGWIQGVDTLRSIISALDVA